MFKSLIINTICCLLTCVTLGQSFDLRQVLTEEKPIICGHRGGYYPNFPENSIEVTRFILEKTGNKPIMVEIDIRSDKEDKLWIMHDSSIDRTTTGNGNLDTLTSTSIENLHLKTQNGLSTEYKILSFEKYLLFVKDKPVLLMLDVKNPRLYPKIDMMLHQYNMAKKALYLTFSQENTTKALVSTNNSLISALVTTENEYHDFLSIHDHHRLAAYVTDITPDTVISQLKKSHIPLISDPRELWHHKYQPANAAYYQGFVQKKKLDILVTDFPIEVVQIFHKHNQLKNKIDMLHLQKFQWLIQKNLDSLSILLHEDVMYIHSNGWTEDKSDVLQDIRTGKLTYLQVIVQESDVRVEENTAIVTGTGIFKVLLEGKPVDIKLYYTEVYVITENGIKLLSRHACKIS